MDTRVYCGDPNSQVEHLCPQGPEGRLGLGRAGRLGARGPGHTLSRQMWEIWKRRMMTQMSPRMSVWSPSTMFSGPMRGIGTCGQQLAGLSCEAGVPEKTQSNRKSRGPAARRKGPGVRPAPGGPHGRKRQGSFGPKSSRQKPSLGNWAGPLGWGNPLSVGYG